MSGHNKWSKIKNKKMVTDSAKSKIFSKMTKLISTASKQVSGDTTSPVLRAAIEKAREYNMPMDNIERAVKKGTGTDTEIMEKITYEAYGPAGSALIIEALTSNRNKAAQEVKFILSKYGFSLAAPGSAAWRNKAAQEVKFILSKYGFSLAAPGSAAWAFIKESDPISGEINWKPSVTVALSEEEEKILGTLIEELEDNDEVQVVYTNAE